MPRDLPASPVTERAVLAACFLDADRAAQALEALTDEDFSEPALRTIFGAVREIRRAGKVPDVLTVLGELERRGQAQEIGGIGFLAGLDVDLPALGELPSYLEELRDRTARRRLIDLAREVVTEASASPAPALSIVSWARTMVDAIEKESAKGHGELEAVGPATREVLAEIDLGPRQLAGLPSGIVDLDRRTLGFCPGQLVVIAGRPGSGKTALAQNIADEVAGNRHRPVAMFSLEMSRVELVHRLLAKRAQVDHSRLRTRYLSAEEQKRIRSAAAAIRDWPLYIDDAGSLSVVDIEARCRRLKVRSGLALVIVDYLHLLTPVRSSGNRSIDLGEMTRFLKQAARSLEVPILLLSQLNRLSEGRADRRPVLSDLRESGAIEQDADQVIFVHRPYGENGQPGIDAELILAKNRAGELADVEVNFIAPMLTFQNRTSRPEAEVA